MADETKKITQIVGSTPTIGLTIEQLSSWSSLPIVVIAEDVDSPGTYRAVQGQFGLTGNFELLDDV